MGFDQIVSPRLLGLFDLLAMAPATESLGQVVPYHTRGTGYDKPAEGENGGTGLGTHMDTSTWETSWSCPRGR